jgi:hypothetical protein
MEASGQIKAAATLPRGKELWQPFIRRLDKPQSRCEPFTEVRIRYNDYAIPVRSVEED